MSSNNNDFLEQQRRAIERLNEMSERSKINAGSHQMPPAPDFVRVQNRKPNNADAHNEEKYDTNEKKSEKKIENNPHNEDSKGTKSGHKGNSPLGNLGLPFKNGIRLDNDISLVLGLLLILANEKADRKLLLALLYILM